MAIIDQVTSDLMLARKSHKRLEVTILSTVLGDLKSRAKLVNGEKVVPDADAISYLDKYIKGLNETSQLSHEAVNTEELRIVERYIPQKLSAAAIRLIVEQHNFANLGEFMGYMKKNHANLYDGKLAADIYKGL
jgi:uncharacterized protein YqeY